MSDRYARSVIEVCETLHTVTNGTHEGPSGEELDRMAQWLADRIVNWVPSKSTNLHVCAFERALYLMATAAYRGHEWHDPSKKWVL